MNIIKNKNSALYYFYTDSNGTEKSTKIANYALNSIAIVNQILSTKNKYETTEFLALAIAKEQIPSKRFIKLISGSDEEDVKSFIKALHKDIVGLSENFSKRTYWLIKEMLYQDISSINIYKNYGYQPFDNIFVFGNKIFDLKSSKLKNYPWCGK